jgi:hypothetical protein
VHLKCIQARRESITVQKRFEVCKRSWGGFLGSKGTQKKFSWSFKGVLCRTQVYDAVKCVVLRL